MATKVAGEQYHDIDGQLLEIKRQLRQIGGYPFDPVMLQRHLQDAIMGQFIHGCCQKLILTKTFNPTEFLGKGWTIEEEDPRLLALTEVNPDKFLFETCLKEGENWITGEEKLARFKEKPDFIPFGADVFLTLWEDYQANKRNSVLEWLFLSKGVKFMDFFGTVLRSPRGSRDVLYLYRSGGGGWGWCCGWLDGGWDAGDPSVGCASSPLVSSES